MKQPRGVQQQQSQARPDHLGPSDRGAVRARELEGRHINSRSGFARIEHFEFPRPVQSGLHRRPSSIATLSRLRLPFGNALRPGAHQQINRKNRDAKGLERTIRRRARIGAGRESWSDQRHRPRRRLPLATRPIALDVRTRRKSKRHSRMPKAGSHHGPDRRAGRRRPPLCGWRTGRARDTRRRAAPLDQRAAQPPSTGRSIPVIWPGRIAREGQARVSDIRSPGPAASGAGCGVPGRSTGRP